MQFDLPPIQALAYLAIGTIVLGVLLLGGIARGRRSPLNYIIGSITCIALGIFLLTLRTTGTITVEPGRLNLKAPLLKTRFVKEGSIDRAWVQDLAGSEWNPARKLNGAAVGLIRSGEFRLHNGRIAFLVLDGDRALCIEVSDGGLYLLGMEDFEPFLEELRSRLPLLAAQLE